MIFNKVIIGVDNNFLFYLCIYFFLHDRNGISGEPLYLYVHNKVYNKKYGAHYGNIL